MVVVGALYLGALSSFTSTAQLRAPAELRGRVLSVLAVVLSSMYPLGSVLQGWLGDIVGLRQTTAGAALLLILAILTLRILDPSFGRALDEPYPATPAPESPEESAVIL